jgi:hypothetical protein
VDCFDSGNNPGVALVEGLNQHLRFDVNRCRSQPNRWHGENNHLQMVAFIRGATSSAPLGRQETLRMNSQKAIGPSIQGQWHGSDAWFQSYLRERSGDTKGITAVEREIQRLSFVRPMTDDMVPSASLSSAEKLP